MANEPGAGNAATEAAEGGTTFGKIRQTLSTSLLTAQDKGKSLFWSNNLVEHILCKFHFKKYKKIQQTVLLLCMSSHRNWSYWILL